MTVKICPECGTENPASEEICVECAFPLDDVSASHGKDPAGSALISPPAPGAPVGDGTTCPRCDEVNPPNAKFCDRCGQRLIGLMPGDTPGAGTPTNQTPQPPPLPDSSPATDTTLPKPPPASEPDPAQAVPPVPVPPPSESPAPAAASEQKWRLVTVEGFHLDKQYALYKSEMSVGRLDPDSNNYPDIDLEGQDDGYVSRRHALIRIAEGVVTVEDLGTENGTILGGRRIPPHKPLSMTPEEVVRFGKVGLQLKAADPKPA